MEGIQVLGERHQGPPADWVPVDGIRRSYGVLGNTSAQLVSGGEWTPLRPGPWGYSTRLEKLKARAFTDEGRNRRIELSLEAIDQPLKYDLDPATWRWVAENADIEDIGYL